MGISHLDISDNGVQVNATKKNSTIADILAEMEKGYECSLKLNQENSKNTKKSPSQAKGKSDGSSKVLRYKTLINLKDGSVPIEHSGEIVDEELLEQDKLVEAEIQEFYNKLEPLLIESGQFSKEKGVDGSYASNMRFLIHYVHDKYSVPGEIDYLDFDEFMKFCNDDSRESWFTSRKFVTEYYEEVFHTLPTAKSNIKKVTYAIQKLINLEQFDKSQKCYKPCHYSLKDDKEMKRTVDHALLKHASFQIDKKKTKNKEIIDPRALMKKNLSRKEFKRVVETWLEVTQKKHGVDEKRLEIMFMLSHDYKSLVRCASCLGFKLKSLLMVQEDDDPPFVGLVVLPGEEKVQDNDCYPSCTIRDIDPELCAQFMLAFLVLHKLQTYGSKLSFLREEKIPNGQMHWSNYPLISNATKSTVGRISKNTLADAGVHSSKVTHMKSCGMNELTKKTDSRRNDIIFEENIKAVSRHENKKAYSKYLSWYQFPIFKSINGYRHNVPYFLNRQENEIPLRIVGNLKLISGFVDQYRRFIEELEGPNGDGLDVSRNLLHVIIPYFIMVVLQDVHHWITKHPGHFYSECISVRINHIDDVEMRAILHKYIEQSAENVAKLQREYEAELKKNSISEANIQMHMTNCTTKLGCQIRSQGFAQRVVLSDNSKKIDQVLENQKKILAYEKANYLINKQNHIMHSFIINHMRKSGSNSSNLEEIFEKICANPIPLSSEMSSLKASISEDVAPISSESTFAAKSTCSPTANADESDVKDPPSMKKSFFEENMLGNNSNLAEIEEELIKCNTRQSIAHVEDSNHPATIVPKYNFGSRLFMVQEINSPVREVNDWFGFQTHKMVVKSSDRKNSATYNMLGKKTLYLNMIFLRAKRLFSEMDKYCFTKTHDDTRWKEQLLHVANLMDQERLAMHPKSLSPSQYFLYLRDIHNGKLNDQITNHFETVKKARQGSKQIKSKSAHSTSNNKLSSNAVEVDSNALDENPTVAIDEASVPKCSEASVPKCSECLIIPTHHQCKNCSILICAPCCSKRGLDYKFYCQNCPVPPDTPPPVPKMSAIENEQISHISAPTVATPKLSINSDASYPIMSQFSSIENDDVIEPETTIRESESTDVNISLRAPKTEDKSQANCVLTQISQESEVSNSTKEVCSSQINSIIEYDDVNETATADKLLNRATIVEKLLLPDSSLPLSSDVNLSQLANRCKEVSNLFTNSQMSDVGDQEDNVCSEVQDISCHIINMLKEMQNSDPTKFVNDYFKARLCVVDNGWTFACNSNTLQRIRKSHWPHVRNRFQNIENMTINRIGLETHCNMDLKTAHLEFIATSKKMPNVNIKQREERNFHKCGSSKYDEVVNGYDVSCKKQCNLESVVTQTEDENCHKMHVKPGDKKRKKRTSNSGRQRKKRRTGSIGVSASNAQVGKLNEDQVEKLPIVNGKTSKLNICSIGVSACNAQVGMSNEDHVEKLPNVNAMSISNILNQTSEGKKTNYATEKLLSVESSMDNIARFPSLMLLNGKSNKSIPLQTSIDAYFQSTGETNDEPSSTNLGKQAPQNDVVNIADEINLPAVKKHYPTGFTANNLDLITEFANYHGLQCVSSPGDGHCCPYSVALSYFNRSHSFNDSEKILLTKMKHSISNLISKGNALFLQGNKQHYWRFTSIGDKVHIPGWQYLDSLDVGVLAKLCNRQILVISTEKSSRGSSHVLCGMLHCPKEGNDYESGADVVHWENKFDPMVIDLSHSEVKGKRRVARRSKLDLKEFIMSKKGIIIAHDFNHFDSLILKAASPFNVPWPPVISFNPFHSSSDLRKCKECLQDCFNDGTSIVCVLCQHKIHVGENYSCSNHFSPLEDDDVAYFTCKGCVNKIVGLCNLTYDDKDTDKMIKFVNSFNVIEFPLPSSNKRSKFRDILTNAINRREARNAVGV